MAGYKEYKDSGIPWLGEIPAHWDIERGKNILALLDRPVKDDDDVITCFRDGEVTLRKNRREDGFTLSLQEVGYQGIEPGDLVVHGMDGFAGSIGVSDSRGKATPVLNVMDSPHNKRYLMYYLRMAAHNDVFLSLSTGIRVRSCDLRWNKLAVFPFVIPERSEQDAIVKYIDRELAKADEIIAEAKASIEEYKVWKASIIYEAVTKGLNTDVELADSGIDYIGRIPKHWKLTSLKRICTRISDGSHFSPETTNEGYPYVTAGDVHGKGIDYCRCRNISEEAFDALVKAGCRPQKGDVLLVKDGATTGRVGLMTDDEPCVLLSSVAMLTPSDTVFSEYLMRLLESEVLQFQIRKSMAGSAMPRTTLTKLQSYTVIDCPYAEQVQIAKYLDVKCEMIDKLIAEKEKLLLDLEAYKKSLIFEVVTGKRKVV